MCDRRRTAAQLTTMEVDLFSFTICRLRPTFQTHPPAQQATSERGRVIAAPPNTRIRIQTPRKPHSRFRLHLRGRERSFVVEFDDRIRPFRREIAPCSWRSHAAASSRSISSAVRSFRVFRRSGSANVSMRSPRRGGCRSGRTSRGSAAAPATRFRPGVRWRSGSACFAPKASDRRATSSRPSSSAVVPDVRSSLCRASRRHSSRINANATSCSSRMRGFRACASFGPRASIGRSRSRRTASRFRSRTTCCSSSAPALPRSSSASTIADTNRSRTFGERRSTATLRSPRDRNSRWSSSGSRASWYG